MTDSDNSGGCQLMDILQQHQRVYYVQKLCNAIGLLIPNGLDDT